jgi:hypothetical protein
MSDERTVDLGSGGRTGLQRKVASVQNVARPVSFIDAKGRIWSVELDLPANITMTTMLQIAKANISLMNNERDVNLSELCVLVEPEDKDQTVLEDVDRIVIMHKKKLDQIERTG